MPPLKCYAKPSPNLNNQDKTENNCNQDCEVPPPVNCGDQNPPPDIDQNSTPVNLVPAVTVRSGQVVQVDHHVKLHPDDEHDDHLPPVVFNTRSTRFVPYSKSSKRPRGKCSTWESCPNCSIESDCGECRNCLDKSLQ